MIITIDGFAASGKSSLARQLANYYNYYYLNTGLLYRAVAYILLDQNININNFMQESRENIAKLLKDKNLEYKYDSINKEQVFIDNKNISVYLKNNTIDNIASIISANINIRSVLLDYQRLIGKNYNLVIDGRDCGSVVFPNADFKFFLTADLEVRARRWQLDQLKYKNNYSIEESINFLKQRDMRDSKREIAPLIVPDNAYIIDTSEFSKEQILEKIINIINKK